MAREVLELSEYDLEIHHIKGTANRHADALSRRPNYDQGKEDNKDVVVLPEQLFICTEQVREEEENPSHLITVEDMTKMNPGCQQNEETLKTWTDPH